MLKRKLKKLFIFTSMLVLICVLLVKCFTTELVIAEINSDNDPRNDQNEEINNNFLNDSINHLIWFVQVIKIKKTFEKLDD